MSPGILKLFSPCFNTCLHVGENVAKKMIQFLARHSRFKVPDGSLCLIPVLHAENPFGGQAG